MAVRQGAQCVDMKMKAALRPAYLASVTVSPSSVEAEKSGAGVPGSSPFGCCWPCELLLTLRTRARVSSRLSSSIIQSRIELTTRTYSTVFSPCVKINPGERAEQSLQDGARPSQRQPLLIQHISRWESWSLLAGRQAEKKACSPPARKAAGHHCAR